MKRLFVVVLFASFVFTQFDQFLFAQDATELKVMSFNIWVGGGKSLEETANVIKTVSADIVGIQEARKGNINTAEKIAKDMGWHTYSTKTTIISRYPIVKTLPNINACKIQIGENKFVWMLNIHLLHCPYGPYQLNGIKYCGAPLLDNAQDAIDAAWKAHQKEVEATIDAIKEAQKDNCPIFLTGDFNEPSHLDWTEKAAKAGICKMPVEWLSTKTFTEKANLKDSYRIKYPNEITHKGHTWTTLPAKREVLDRIDFVFFHGKNVDVVDVQVVGEKSDLSDIKFEKYPSDHRAVLGIFKIKN